MRVRCPPVRRCGTADLRDVHVRAMWRGVRRDDHPAERGERSDGALTTGRNRRRGFGDSGISIHRVGRIPVARRSGGGDSENTGDRARWERRRVTVRPTLRGPTDSLAREPGCSRRSVPSRNCIDPAPPSTPTRNAGVAHHPAVRGSARLQGSGSHFHISFLTDGLPLEARRADTYHGRAHSNAPFRWTRRRDSSPGPRLSVGRRCERRSARRGTDRGRSAAWSV